MDYAQVNDVLSRANAEFERRELEDLRGYELERLGDTPADSSSQEKGSEQLEQEEEMYMGDSGTVSPDFSPSGDPVTGSDQGVDNLASDAEIFLSFITDSAASIASRYDVSDQDALDAIYATADELAMVGELPAMPDVETSTAEELTGWVGKAKTLDLMSLAVNAVKDAKGEDQLHVTAGA